MTTKPKAVRKGAVPAVAVELTTEQKIAAAWAGRTRALAGYAYAPSVPPASRRFRHGMKLDAGFRKDCVVVFTNDEGTEAVFQHHVVKTEFGKERDLGLSYDWIHWTRCTPIDEMQPTSRFNQMTWNNSFAASSLEEIIRRCEDADMNFQPDYQRGYVWGQADRELYIESVFEGRDLGRFLFVVHPYPGGIDILDGQQRLTTLRDFRQSRWTFEGLYWHQFSIEDRRRFNRRLGQFADLDAEHFTKAQLLEIFLTVNCAGVPQTEEHLAKVRALLKAEKAAAQKVQP